MKNKTQDLILPVLVDGEVTTYAIQALFTLGNKKGETKHQVWSITTSRLTIEEAEYDLSEIKFDGHDARIVKITTKAEVI